MSSTTLKAYRKKASKPMMEKRRRARINHSLAELKELIVNFSKHEFDSKNCRRSKLEKADILEMTVRYLHSLHKHRLEAAERDDVSCDAPSPPPVQKPLDKFRAGFHECVNEVNRYMNSEVELSRVDCTAKSKLATHLNGCLNRMQSDNGAPDGRSLPGSGATTTAGQRSATDNSAAEGLPPSKHNHLYPQRHQPLLRPESPALTPPPLPISANRMDTHVHRKHAVPSKALDEEFWNGGEMIPPNHHSNKIVMVNVMPLLEIGPQIKMQSVWRPW